MGDRISDIVTGLGTTNVAPVTPYEAVIANTVTAVGQDLFITIPSIDQGRTTKGPVRWNPLPGFNGLIYPTKNDIAQVVRTQEGYYWVTQFIPAIFPANVVSEIAASFPTASGQLDITVPSGTNLVALDFEFEVAAATASTGLLPNGDTTTLTNDTHYVSSTRSPDVIAAPAVAISSQVGLWLHSSFGAAGAVRVIGQAKVVTRNYSGRTLMTSDVTYTNTVGSANAGMFRLRSSAIYDLAAAITFLRFKTTTGNFNGGIVKAKFN